MPPYKQYHQLAADGVQVFAVSGALDRAEARYAWLRKRLRSRASVWAIFPPAWKLPQLVSLSFCNITRAQLAEALDSKVGMTANCLCGHVRVGLEGFQCMSVCQHTGHNSSGAIKHAAQETR